MELFLQTDQFDLSKTAQNDGVLKANKAFIVLIFSKIPLEYLRLLNIVVIILSGSVSTPAFSMTSEDGYTTAPIRSVAMAIGNESAAPADETPTYTAPTDTTPAYTAPTASSSWSNWSMLDSRAPAYGLANNYPTRPAYTSAYNYSNYRPVYTPAYNYSNYTPTYTPSYAPALTSTYVPPSRPIQQQNIEAERRERERRDEQERQRVQQMVEAAAAQQRQREEAINRTFERNIANREQEKTQTAALFAQIDKVLNRYEEEKKTARVMKEIDAVLAGEKRRLEVEEKNNAVSRAEAIVEKERKAKQDRQSSQDAPRPSRKSDLKDSASPPQTKARVKANTATKGEKEERTELDDAIEPSIDLFDIFAAGKVAAGVGKIGAVGYKAVCFPGETSICISKEQTKTIQTIQVGDFVESCNMSFGGATCECRQVDHIFKSTTDHLVKLSFAGRMLRSTDNHPFYVTNKKAWVEAQYLEEGDLLQTISGEVVSLERIDGEDGKFEVYNLDVQENHNYYANGVLVHNCDVVGKVGTKAAVKAEAKAVVEGSAKAMSSAAKKVESSAVECVEQSASGTIKSSASAGEKILPTFEESQKVFRNPSMAELAKASKEGRLKEFSQSVDRQNEAALGALTKAKNVPDSAVANVAKSRNKPPAALPEAKGTGHSIIERPGKSGQYTTHNGDGTWKQYRGSGQDHGSIPRPNVKETGLNTNPNTGKTYISKPEVRLPRPNEYPGSK